MAVSESSQVIQIINQFNGHFVKKSQNLVYQILKIEIKLNHSKLLTNCELDNYQILISNTHLLIDRLR